MSLNGNLFVPLGGWGRNINHDPTSKAYRASRAGEVALPTSVTHDVRIAVMDQGNLGSCVPHAGTELLTTDPFWDTLDKAVQKQLMDPTAAEAFAQQAYRDVTRLDPYPGQWEPDDTGSDGLSLWKLFRQRGYVGGSEHVMSIDDAHVLIQKTAYPIGISWLSGMDSPGRDGVVKVTGTVRGGHEILLYAYDAARDLWWCRNHWSKDWGLNGNFAFDTPGYQKLMDMQGDGTGMTPLTAPDPQPVTPDNYLRTDRLDLWASKCKPWWPRYERDAAADWKEGRSALS